MQWTRLILTCFGIAVRRIGMLGFSVRKIKELIVKKETAKLIGKGR